MCTKTRFSFSEIHIQTPFSGQHMAPQPFRVSAPPTQAPEHVPLSTPIGPIASASCMADFLFFKCPSVHQTNSSSCSLSLTPQAEDSAPFSAQGT